MQETAPQIEELTPKRIVEELDKFIIGQTDAKKTVSIALRNRTRRMRLEPTLQEEVNPKNIIMMGPTGVGKTEIARRLAKLVKAPFVKVEATKYTEIGYVGRDVESMVRDLVETAVNMIREEDIREIRPRAENKVHERLLDLLDRGGTSEDFERRRRFISGLGTEASVDLEAELGTDPEEEATGSTSRDRLSVLLDEGRLEDHEVEFDISVRANVDGMIGIAGVDDQMMGNIKDMMEKVMPARKKTTRMKVGEARKILIEEELEQLLDNEKIQRLAVERAEQSGIIFIDEIDKIVGRKGGSGPDVSREGVQRDILPIIEGSTVFTKHGLIRTDHVLFIAAGAFHMSKPSDLIPELQGRFPLRVELESLDADDFRRILVEPENSLIRQYVELMKTDGVELDFTDDGITELALSASKVNEQAENIGARRLYSILERVLEEVAFEAPDSLSGRVVIDRQYVLDRLGELLEDQDLSRFIL
jgi:ATP-dependent HslUV protease ATP-binding subunit HslU